MTDLHCHLMPAVDDGARDLDQTRHALAAMRQEGVVRIVATPHVRGMYTTSPDVLRERFDEIDAGWRLLERIARDEFPGLEVLRGAEVMLDAPVDLSDDRLRLAGGPLVLVEFPLMRIPPDSGALLARVRAAGWLPVLAHPERYRGLGSRFAVVGDWLAAGAYLQLNAGSFAGRYGPEARELAFRLLERGWGHYIATDYHARGRPGVKALREILRERRGEQVLRLCTEANPRRATRGETPLPVPPLPGAGGILSRLLRRLR